jgi:glycosyltransferase involved in cell wall biosynthesis
MRKLRVALVAPSLDILGGQAVQADRLLRAWLDDPEIESFLVPVNPVPPGPLKHARKVKFLRTIVTEAIYVPSLVPALARADVAHVFSASYTSFLLAPLPAILTARALGCPVVLNYRSGEGADHLARSAVARRALANVNRAVVPSRFLAEVFARFGIATAVIANVVDLDRFRFRERAPLRPRLLSTRNLEPLYNVACTLRAFRLVQDRHPDATLTLVGGGREDAALRALADSLGLRGVTFAGRIPPSRIAEYYASHDIYLQSPSIDNMPTSLLEAFASGMPVVSTDAGGIGAILTHGKHGLLAPIGDHHGLAAHVLTLLATPALAGTLSHAAYGTCAAYTWTALREQWLRLYRSVVPSSARRPASAPSHDAA